MSSWFRTHPYFYLAGTEHVKDRKLLLSLFRKVYGFLQRFILQEDYSMHQDRSAVLELLALPLITVGGTASPLCVGNPSHLPVTAAK